LKDEWQFPIRVLLVRDHGLGRIAHQKDTVANSHRRAERSRPKPPEAGARKAREP
jgi:hypothetical protein